MEEKKEWNPNNNYDVVSKKLCKFGCGNSIRFDPNVLSRISRKMIPLNLDNTPHNCPNGKFKKNTEN